MSIAYIPDLVFHQCVDDLVSGALEFASGENRLALDGRFTETLLASGIWPQSWEVLMPEQDKAYLIERIIIERQQRA
jgi:hypothetical protein